MAEDEHFQFCTDRYGFKCGPAQIPENSIISDTNCLSAAEKGPFDLRELSDPDDSAAISDSVSSEWSCSTGQSGKLRNPEEKAQIQLSNRFDCLEDEECPERSYKNSGLNDRESIFSSRGSRYRGPPKTFRTKINSTNSITSKTSPNPDLLAVNGTVEHKSLV